MNVIYLCVCFILFVLKDGKWDLIVLIRDHCRSIYFILRANSMTDNLPMHLKLENTQHYPLNFCSIGIKRTIFTETLRSLII